MNTIPFILISWAGILTVLLYQLIQERKLNRILERSNPEFPDLTPLFVELQQRISSEAEQSRKEATSHARNSQTVVRTLTGVVKQLPKADELAECISNEATSVVYAIAEDIKIDGKKTRKDIQEVKTALRDDEKDDQRSKSAARRIASLLESGAELDIQEDSILPYGTMVLRDEESGEEMSVTGVTPEALVKAARKASKPKKRKGAK